MQVGNSDIDLDLQGAQYTTSQIKQKNKETCL